MEYRYLFKAKRVDNGEWVTGSYVYAFTPERGHVVGIMGDNHFIVEKNGNIVSINEDTICQCTGLKDKNGKLIWENDIIKDNVIYGVVRWDEVNARYIVDDREDGYQDYSEWWHECEVIGNIFDNPELLESEG